MHFRGAQQYFQIHFHTTASFSPLCSSGDFPGQSLTSAAFTALGQLLLIINQVTMIPSTYNIPRINCRDSLADNFKGQITNSTTE